MLTVIPYLIQAAVGFSSWLAEFSLTTSGTVAKWYLVSPHPPAACFLQPVLREPPIIPEKSEL